MRGLVGDFADARCRTLQDRAAVVWRAVGPVRKRAGRGLDRLVAVFAPAEGHQPDDLFGGGIDHVPRAAAGRGGPRAVDVLLIGEHLFFRTR